MSFTLPPNYKYKYSLHFLITLKSYQEDANKSLIISELAEKMGVTDRTVRKWSTLIPNDNSVDLSDKTLEDIASYFNVQKNELLSNSMKEENLSV